MKYLRVLHKLDHQAVAAVLFFVIVMLAGCSSQEDAGPVLDFNDTHELSVESNGANAYIRVAVAAMTGPKESRRYYSRLVNYIADKIGKRIAIVQRRSYAEINELLKNGDVDLAFLCSGGYVDAVDEGSVKLLCAPVIDGRTTYQSYIIVPSSSHDTCFLDLKNKVFAFTDPLSNTGCIYPKWLLRETGRDPMRFFAQTVFTHGHDNSIEAVARGIVDGAAVDGLVYEFLQKHRPFAVAGTRVVHKSPEFGMPPVVVRTGVSGDVRKQMLDAMLSMDRDSTGATILKLLGIDSFVVVDDSLYASVRAMKHD